MAEHTNMNNSTLFLLRYLAENTDMDHPVTSVQLQKVLASSDTGTVLLSGFLTRGRFFQFVILFQNHSC